MKNSLTLLVGMALLAGTAQAAPLALRTADHEPTSPELLKPAAPRPEKERRSMQHMLLRTLGEVNSETNGFHIESPSLIKRKLAAKSASAASSAANSSISDGTKIVAQVGYSTSPNIQRNRFYILPHTSASNFTLFHKSGTPAASFNGQGYYNEEDNTFRGISSNSVIDFYGKYYEINMENCATDEAHSYQFDESKVGLIANCVERDPVSGKVYGQFYKDDGSYAVWGYVDYREQTRTAIRNASYTTVDVDGELFVDDPGELLYVLGATYEGEFYGVEWDGTLVMIDKTTGVYTEIGDTGVPVEYQSAGCINPENNTFLIAQLADSDNNGSVDCTYLYEIDLTTAHATIIAKYPAVQFFNMFVVTETSPKVPAAPRLAMSAPYGRMTVSYTLTLPDTLADGTPVDGEIEWEITESGETLVEGKNLAGSSLTGQLTMTEAGMKRFIAVAKNAEGNSAKTVVEIFVGQGTPKVPANVKAEYDSGIATLTWDPVEASADGGFINYPEIKYDVYYDGMVVGYNLDVTTCSFRVPYPDQRAPYQFTVVAKYFGKNSAPGLSNIIYLGPIDLPYDANFMTEEGLEASGVTVIDANGDGRTWEFYNSSLCYSWNDNLAGDDWFFTPDMRFEAGKLYDINMMVRCGSPNLPEKFEIKAGKQARIADMTETLLETTVVNYIFGKIINIKYIPTESGIRSIGVHAISDPKMYNLYVGTFTISEGMIPTAPATPANITLTPDATGLLKCNVTIEAPTKTLMDQPLTEGIKLLLRRDGELIATLDAQPGATVTYKDETVPARGTYTYSCTAANADDEEGTSISKEVFVGPYPMAATTRCEFFETHETGTVTVIWDAVTKDINGNAVDPSQVSYMVYRVTNGTVGEPMLEAPTKNLKATFKAIEDPDTQEFCQFCVGAFNRDAEPVSLYGSAMLPVGKPYDMPVVYSDANCLNQYIMGMQRTSADISVGVYDNTSFGFPGVDDNYFFGIKFSAASQLASIYTGLIDLTSEERPEVCLWTYKVAENDRNQLQVAVMHDATETVVETFSHENMEEGWNKLTISLADYVGKNVQVKVYALCVNYTYFLMDRIEVRARPAVDLNLAALAAPRKVEGGVAFSITAEVENLGWDTAENATVNLYRDGELIQSREVESIESDRNVNVVFDDVISYFDDNTLAVYSAEAVCAEDEDLSNNNCADIYVERTVSTLPVVNDLEAEASEEGVKLTWTPYTNATEVGAMTESFESGEPYAKEFEGWTFIDKDDNYVWTVNNVAIPGLGGQNKCAWMVIDTSEEQFDTSWTPASGDKLLLSAAQRDGDNSDWAISPLLSGDEQTVTFMAKTFDDYDGLEHLQLLVAYEDTLDPDEYDLVDDFEDIPTDWTKFSVEIPEGAMRFAIVNVGNGDENLFVFVDDVTFTPDLSAIYLELKGYDIYRNGVKINEAPVNGGEYFDTESGFGKHIYHVVALYDKGSSELSNEAEVEVANSGLDYATHQQASVKVEGRTIVVTGADNKLVSIATVDGKLLYRGNGDCRYTASPAIYLVTLDNRTYKVSVR